MRHEPAYKSAEVLGISEELRQGLIGVMRDLADGTIPDERFCMSAWCGSACCISGHLSKRLGKNTAINSVLQPLFLPFDEAYMMASSHQGAQAILNFLMGRADPWARVA